MASTTRKTWFIAFIVSLGGFLYGFDAAIISGVMNYVTPEFDLSTSEQGWVPSSPLFAAMFAMLISGRASDILGRKKMLLIIAFTYALSALLSAYATGFHMLWIARMIGGIAFGAALVIAPVYIAEVSSAEARGKLVSIQQLNIVLGFFAAFLSNYYINNAFTSESTSFLTNANVWRFMLAVELLPALLYFILLFFVPRSPRWLFIQERDAEAVEVLTNIHGTQKGTLAASTIVKSLSEARKNKNKIQFKGLFKKPLRFVLTVGIGLGILQQITGINAVYYYATSIFKQTGIGTDAAFASGILLSLTTVLFTFVAIFLIDKMGRRPLLLVGVGGIAISMLLCGYGFQKATYAITEEKLMTLEPSIQEKLQYLTSKEYNNDIDFKNEMLTALGSQVYTNNEGAILEAATRMNPTLVLMGILGFIACFAFSLGPVMWVMLSELFPNRYRGLAIGFVGFLNGLSSWLVTQAFPWELVTWGNAITFYIYGVIALVGFFVFLKILPETKGKSLEELEKDLIKP
ncbi:sugar porter family MFS transporter [Flagellimonas hymeniacidonis]|uniref:Sugar porter family MFS transporter n=1 Tax=Flagellimonas hymeniacidonis TaxID=2603628 RepID=A0A5C8VAS1_9FLAO|nr:sugar porter family MFS transporter [Flagellimonas hymeniacidonis]TXN38269.1 sugar porter family MFS transporter [Flagellimonas hymeniacidonis]